MAVGKGDSRGTVVITGGDVNPIGAEAGVGALNGETRIADTVGMHVCKYP